jgi:hypothetical protein
LRSELGFKPAEPSAGIADRAIFAADPALIAQAVDQGEQEGIIDLSQVRFVSARIAGDLDVTDQGKWASTWFAKSPRMTWQ